jgi:NAD(P)-dependent dehydrogenase (short-subunit alcohol dehydrogenase family)
MTGKKYAIVTGAASGLGRAIAVELGRHGWHIAICDLNDQASSQTLARVQEAGGTGQVEHLDVTKSNEWAALGERLRSAWPALDLLVNNAGVGVGGEVGQLPLEDWQWIVNINLWGAVYGCHTLVPWMKTNSRGGHIVNIASLAAIASAPGMAPYNITKAAMVSLSETLYGELKPFHIGVTAVCPAFFPTNIIDSGRFHTNEQRALATQLMSQSRMTADEVARRIVRAVERNELYVFVPATSKTFWRFKRLLPKAFLNMVARRGARAAPK